MKSASILGLFLAAAASVGCGADFDPGSRVTSLRVLAQQADAPFAKPGETVNISSLSYDPEGRTVNWAWAVCVNPAASTVDGCLSKLAMDAANSGQSPIAAQGPGLDTFSVTIPDDALTSLPDAAKPAAMVGIISVACPGDLTLAEGAGGLPFRCSETATGRELALDEFALGMKRISVRSSDRNENPSIEQISFDGADWPEDEVKLVAPCDRDDNAYAKCASETQHKLAAHVSSSSFESGQTEFGVAFSEQVVIEHYATEGIFENDIKIASDPENGWVARRSASGQDLTLWFVVHDDRGGATWATRQVHVQ
jgi:hypothetical protein